MVIKGDRIIIKSTEKNDLESIKKLWNNGEVMKWVGFPAGLNQSIKDMQVWWKKIKENNNTHHFVVFTKNDKFCGELYYKKEPKYNRAGLDIKFLPKLQGKGLATEALQLLINHIFNNEPEVNTLWTEPSKENVAARKLYSRCFLSSKERPKDMETAESYWELSRKEWQNSSNYE